MFSWAQLQCGARTECRPVRNKGVLDLISTRRALIGSVASDVAAAMVMSAGPPSPRSLLLSCSLALSLFCFLWSLTCSSFPSLFVYSPCGLVIYLLEDFRVSVVAGLRSWECCAPYRSRINILGRLLPSLSVCVHRGELLVLIGWVKQKR